MHSFPTPLGPSPYTARRPRWGAGSELVGVAYRLGSAVQSYGLAFGGCGLRLWAWPRGRVGVVKQWAWPIGWRGCGLKLGAWPISSGVRSKVWHWGVWFKAVGLA